LGRREKMADMVMGERWNATDSTDMALGTRRAINSVMRREELPKDSVGFLQKAIAFLEEARDGGALVAGRELSSARSFNGTFSPLCLATDVYITFKGGSVDRRKGKHDYGEVGRLLGGYADTLRAIEEKGVNAAVRPENLREVAGFFRVLSDLLLQQEDPTTKGYSRPYFDRRDPLRGQVGTETPFPSHGE
jgi:hypothetical protein